MKRQSLPIDPTDLAKSIGTLTDLHPEQDLAATLQQAVSAAKQLFDADAAGRLRWASLLRATARAELTGELADQQVALESRSLIERAKGALMERERLDEQEAFTHLRRAARSSGRKLSEVAAEVATGLPLPKGRTRPTSTQAEQAEG